MLYEKYYLARTLLSGIYSFINECAVFYLEGMIKNKPLGKQV